MKSSGWCCDWASHSPQAGGRSAVSYEEAEGPREKSMRSQPGGTALLEKAGVAEMGMLQLVSSPYPSACPLKSRRAHETPASIMNIKETCR